jgi:tripartite-type tricarboxylate transporter receptor subunit TctC
MPPARSGKLRALAVTTLSRSSIAPDLPTMAEAGVRNFEVSSWTALFTTGGTALPVIDRLNLAVIRLKRDQAYRERLREMGSDVVSSTPEELAEFVRAEIAKWRRAVQQSGVQAD